jgi:hypothetical protein
MRPLHHPTSASWHSDPVVSGEVPTEPEKVFALRIVFHHRPRPHREAGADLYVLQRLFARGERFIEHVGLAQPHSIIEPHARFDEGGGLFTRNVLRWSASDPPRHAVYLSTGVQPEKRKSDC